MTICARSGRCSRRRRTFQRTVYRPGEICQFDLWEPRRRDPGRPRPDPQRLGRDRVSGLLARGRRRAGLLQADPGPALRDPPLPVVARGAAADAGLGPPGRAARPRRPADRGVRRVLRRSCGSAGTSASRADPQAKGVVERLQGYAGDAASSPAGASRTSSTSRCSSTPGLPSARTPRTHKTLRAGRSTACSRSAR